MRGMIGALALAGLTAGWLAGAGEPSIFYSREHRASRPSYVQITLERDGSAVYRESADDPDEQPVRFRLHPAETEEVFRLAEQLDRFQRPLESNLKVADMGVKTFRWLEGGQNHEQKFNFSKDADARLLADWFARMTETAEHYIRLERAVQFDKLGTNKVLLELQVSAERNRLVAAELFLPLLDKIAKTESFLNMARSRAAGLAETIRQSGGDGR